MSATSWLEEVKRLETQREQDARAKGDADRQILAQTAEWIRAEVEPAMARFGDELRTLGREVAVVATETACRVEVRDPQGLVPKFIAEVGTESADSALVRDQMPLMTAVFEGLDRRDVEGARIYEALKMSYLSKLRSRAG